MTKEELIKELRKFDKNAKIYFKDNCSNYHLLSNIYSKDGDIILDFISTFKYDYHYD